MEHPDLPFRVTAMTVQDVAEVSALEQQVFTYPWSIHAFEYEVQHNPMAYFSVVRPYQFIGNPDDLAQLASRWLHRTLHASAQKPLLGYGGFWLIVDEAHICTLAIHQRWRGRGLGELLLQHMLEQAIRLDAAVATLEVRVTNHVAQRLYRKYTFAEVGLRKGYYQDNCEDALIMTTAGLTTAEFTAAFQANRAALSHRLLLQRG